MAGRVLSVDYGSSSTVAAMREPDGRDRLLLFDSSPLLPSAVCADADGALVGGQEAQHLARVHPERYEPTPKRRIGQIEMLLGDRAYPVVDAVAVTLRLVTDAATEATGAAPDTVTVTHPAGWPATRRGVLVEAARRAGLPEPILVPEPVAAARYFRNLSDCPAGPLVVYDLGAGTCDVSVIADDGTVLAVDGIDDLGGADLDEIVVTMVAEAVPAAQLDRWRAMTAPTSGPDRRYFRLLWDDARAARELLSRRAGTQLHLPALGIDAPVGRERFERAAGPVLVRSAGLAAGLIGRAGTTPTELAGIVLVGGASRTPLVATLLHQTIGVAPTMLDQPELVVAEGGLLAAAAPAASPTGVAPGAELAGTAVPGGGRGTSIPVAAPAGPAAVPIGSLPAAPVRAAGGSAP
ncbi:Hsp70 family protein, partial [Actinocatenispora thailandica]